MKGFVLNLLPVIENLLQYRNYTQEHNNEQILRALKTLIGPGMLNTKIKECIRISPVARQVEALRPVLAGVIKRASCVVVRPTKGKPAGTRCPCIKCRYSSGLARHYSTFPARGATGAVAVRLFISHGRTSHSCFYHLRPCR